MLREDSLGEGDIPLGLKVEKDPATSRVRESHFGGWGVGVAYVKALLWRRSSAYLLEDQFGWSTRWGAELGECMERGEESDMRKGDGQEPDHAGPCV